MRKKWSFWDIVVLVIEILSPLISIIITCFIPMSQQLDPDKRLAIIGAGISLPIVLLQISLTQGQNETGYNIQEVDKKIDIISEKTNHISPVLEQVFISGNDRVQRFAFRRFKEVCKTIQSAVNNNNSGNLRPNEYYEELLYLAELILTDKAENKNKFTGEIWAMTAFAEEEWIADAGYEKLWTAKLKEMVDGNGIKTRRLCLIPDSVYNIISTNPFKEPSDSEYSFWGFIELLQSYYSNSISKKITEHYIIREQDNLSLKDIKGFFAIKLTNGDLHILYGETVDSNGALTAKVLFDSNEIREVRKLFELYTIPSYKMECKLKEIVKSNGFIEYLQKKGITF